MRCLLRNKSKMYYRYFQDKTPLKDEYGNSTGEYKNNYGPLIEFYAYVTPDKGTVDVRRFGDQLSYDRVIVLDNESPEINEYSKLWVDTMPTFDEYGHVVVNDDLEVSVPPDYRVKKVAKSLNSTLVAISKVNVSA